MIYSKELTDKVITDYQNGKSAKDIASALSEEFNESVTERSVIAKLSHHGVYKKKAYLTKRGEAPIKKAEYVDMLAKLLGTEPDILESLEKVNKSVLELIYSKINLLQTKLSVYEDDESEVDGIDM